MKLFDFFRQLFDRRAFKRKTRKKHIRKSSTRHRKKEKAKRTRTRIKTHRRSIRKRSAPRIRRSRNTVKKRARRRAHSRLPEKQIGVITHYFDKISVGVVKLSGPLALAAVIRIKGKRGDYTQVVSSMQSDHKEIAYASKGMDIGIKVTRPVQERDKVYIIN